VQHKSRRRANGRLGDTLRVIEQARLGDDPCSHRIEMASTRTAAINELKAAPACDAGGQHRLV
jgi:hypothetical protein